MTPPTFLDLNLDIQGNWACLTLNRPTKLNALRQNLLKELSMAATWLNSQHEIRVVIIKGAGKAFSAGADLQDAASAANSQLGWVERRDSAQIGLRMTQSIRNMRAITIAQVHGYAIGGAFLLMLACDFRFAAEGTIFSIPEVDLGIPLSWGGIPMLVSEIGPAMTKELVMTCRSFNARDALNLGLLNEILPLEQLESHCSDFRQTILDKPSVPIAMTKEQVNSISKKIGEAYVASAEGDMLQNALQDPASRAAAEAYLKRNIKKNSNSKG